MFLSNRDKLFTLSYQYKGNWNQINSHLNDEQGLNEENYHDAIHATHSLYLTIKDKDYPKQLQAIIKPPFVLYAYGNISLLHKKYRLSVVGTRKPTLYQNNMVYQLIQEVERKTENQTVIISGMAKGIDQAALRAAKDIKAPIIAVIASGIDNPYPLENHGLYEYCKAGYGLVISEYPDKEKAKKENFIFRNRIIVGLSDSLFVGGGTYRSGTSSSVNQAIEYNKNILALPCNITGNDLTNLLIKDGAESVLSAQDILVSLKQL